MVTIQVITQQDLLVFKQELLASIKDLLKVEDSDPKWLKAKEVKTLLSVSDNTLRQLRIEGKLTRVRVGRSYYYDKQQVLNLFTERRSID